MDTILDNSLISRQKGPRGVAAAYADDYSYQAFQILRLAFTVAPIAMGLDKFFGLLVNWDLYLPPLVNNMLGGYGHEFMYVVGVIEVVAGIGIFLLPRIFAYVVAAWLGLIIINLLMIPGYFDIALRDLGLLLGALALGRLSHANFDRQNSSAGTRRKA